MLRRQESLLRRSVQAHQPRLLVKKSTWISGGPCPCLLLVAESTTSASLTTIHATLASIFSSTKMRHFRPTRDLRHGHKINLESVSKDFDPIVAVSTPAMNSQSSCKSKELNGTL